MQGHGEVFAVLQQTAVFEAEQHHVVRHGRERDGAAGGNLDAGHRLHLHQVALHHVLMQLGFIGNGGVDTDQAVGAGAGVVNHEIRGHGRRIGR